MATGNVSSTGLSVVYDPPDGEDPIADIIFVHGLQGHPRDTWSFAKAQNAIPSNNTPRPKSRLFKNWFRKNDATSTTNGADIDIPADAETVFWPQDLLPHDCDRARILTWGYESHVTRGYEATNKNNVFAHAKNLLAVLRREHPEGRPIIFVAHSLGGILVKEALRRSNELASDVVRSTYAVIFLGTPHRGSAKAADIGEAFRRTASILLRVDSNSTLLRALGADSPELEIGRESFIVLWKNYQFSVKTFQESKPLTGVNLSILNELVVSRESSSLDDPQENAETIEADHHMMCKFCGADDPGYRQVGGELRAFVRSIAQKQTETLHAESMTVSDNVTGLHTVAFLLKHIPLLTNYIEHFTERVSQKRTTKQYENVFMDSLMLLISSNDMFEKSCRKLVQSFKDVQIRNLMNFQTGWNEPGIETELRRTLGDDSFEKYCKMTGKVVKVIKEVEKKLRLRGAVEESFNAWLGSSFDQGMYRKAITKIHKDIEKIFHLTQQNMNLKVVEEERPPSSGLEKWLDIRKHTSDLFNALSSIWPRNCVRHTHHAKFRLDIPTQEQEDQEEPKFNVSFLADKAVRSTQCCPQGWRDVTVVPSQTSSPVSSNKTVRFPSPTIIIESVQPFKICAQGSEIQNLCSTLENTCHGSCLGFLPGDGCHYHIHNPTNHTRELTRLGDFLTNKRLTTRERRTIALTLAFGVLQLYDTPWLCDSWSVDEIYIERSQNTTSFYVFRNFERLPQPQTFNNPRMPEFVRNQILFSLGVALLQVFYGAPLPGEQTESDGNPYAAQCTVFSLAKQIHLDELPRFSGAVSKCIYPDVQGHELSLADEGPRRRFVRDVLLPLKEDYDQLPRF